MHTLRDAYHVQKKPNGEDNSLKPIHALTMFSFNPFSLLSTPIINIHWPLYPLVKFGIIVVDKELPRRLRTISTLAKRFEKGSILTELHPSIQLHTVGSYLIPSF